MSRRATSFSKPMQVLRYGKQVIALGDEIAAVREQLSVSVRLLEGSAEAKELDAKRTQLLQAVNDFPRLAQLRQYLFRAHGIATESELLPPCRSHKPAPPIGVVCPACGRSILISVDFAMWDGSTADRHAASGISEHGICTKCGSKLSRSKQSRPVRDNGWGPWHKQ